MIHLLKFTTPSAYYLADFSLMVVWGHVSSITVQDATGLETNLMTTRRRERKKGTLLMIRKFRQDIDIYDSDSIPLGDTTIRKAISVKGNA